MAILKMFRRRGLGRGAAMVVGLGLVTVAMLSARGAGEPRNGAEPLEAVTVTMTDGMAFAPASITIEEGTTVTWKNTSSVPHTVTAIPGKASNRANVRLPGGAEPFGSGTLAPGASFRHTFTVAGTYKYFCVPHEAAGMVGTVIVKG